jgi:hypothetical protein
MPFANARFRIASRSVLLAAALLAQGACVAPGYTRVQPDGDGSYYDGTGYYDDYGTGPYFPGTAGWGYYGGGGYYQPQSGFDPGIGLGWPDYYGFAGWPGDYGPYPYFVYVTYHDGHRHRRVASRSPQPWRVPDRPRMAPAAGADRQDAQAWAGWQRNGGDLAVRALPSGDTGRFGWPGGVPRRDGYAFGVRAVPRRSPGNLGASRSRGDGAPVRSAEPHAVPAVSAPLRMPAAPPAAPHSSHRNPIR